MSDPEVRWLARALELSALGVPQVALPCAEVLRRAPTPVRVCGALLREACLEHCRALASPKG